ncbi:hypothetical protein Tco_0005360 [Tanacetum coccineum]
MVAYLEKTDGNDEFHEIIDFLTRNSIYYALTLLASLSQSQKHQLEVIFNLMMLLGLMVTKNSRNVTPLFPSMLAQPTEDEGAVSERPSETQPTPSPTHPSEDQSEPQPDPFPRPSSSNPIPDSIPEGSSGNHGGQLSSDRSLSGNEDGLTLQSVHDLCVSLCKQVTTQAAQIKDLKAQIKQLKKKAKPKESVSKQGRKPAKSEPTVHKDPTFDDLDDAMDYMETEDAHDEGIVKDSEETRVSTEDQVSTDKLKVSTDKPNEGTAEPKDGNSDESAAPTTVFRDDETIAQFLVTMSQNKTKQKGFEIKEIKDTDRPRTTTERSILTLKPLPKIDPKDKGKKVLEEKAESDAESEGVNEAERKFAQLANDEEIARKVQEEWEAEEEKKKLAEEEATKAAFTNEYDFIQARLNADKILAEKLQEEEREKFTIEERVKLLHDTITAQRRFLAQQRATEIRRGRKHSNLKNKNFEKIQVLYAKVKNSDENFVAIGSAEDERIIRELNKKAAGTKKADSIKEKSKEEAGTRKRKLGTRKKMKSRKRRFKHGNSEDEKENDELKLCLTIAPDEDKEVDYEILDRKYPIKEWTTENLGIKPQFDETKEDLNAVYKLVMDIYQNEVPKGFDRVLWGDLMIMFNPNDEDEFWNTQQDWNVLESEEDSTMALELIRFVKKLIAELEPEDSDGNEEDL